MPNSQILDPLGLPDVDDAPAPALPTPMTLAEYCAFLDEINRQLPTSPQRHDFYPDDIVFEL